MRHVKLTLLNSKPVYLPVDFIGSISPCLVQPNLPEDAFPKERLLTARSVVQDLTEAESKDWYVTEAPEVVMDSVSSVDRFQSVRCDSCWAKTNIALCASCSGYDHWRSS